MPRQWLYGLAWVGLVGGVAARVRWPELLAQYDIEALKASSNGDTPKHLDMFPATSNVSSLPAQHFTELGSQRKKITYGPFDVQSMDIDNGMVDYVQVGAMMPCEDCTITFVHAGLEYPNGTYANANTSLWLHHTALINYMEPDFVCGTDFFAQGERWFASGNERTIADLTRGGTFPMGYYIDAYATHIMAVELMNTAMFNQTAVLTLEYEYIPSFPSTFYKLAPIWMDIGGCNGSDKAPLTEDFFTYTSPPFTATANVTGAIVGIGAHLHDGGVTLSSHKNDQPLCVNTAYYGTNGGYYDPEGTMYLMDTDEDPFDVLEMDQMDHISQMSVCYAPVSGGMLKAGDEITITATYNLTAHMPMLDVDGELAPIMGISMLYVAQNMSEEVMMKYASQPPPQQVFPTLIDPAMVMSGDDGGTSSMTMTMKCSSADSPGNLSTIGLDMTDPNIQTDFLTALLDDACLQLWSSAYAQYFWYCIAAVIGLFTLHRVVRVLALRLRQRNPSRSLKVGFGTNHLRALLYRQYTPTHLPRVLKVPPMGTFLMLLGYLALILCLVFMRSSTGDDQAYQSIGVRAAWITVAQLPLVILLASKRNFIDYFTAVSYERLNVLHRWVARGLFLTATFHFGFQNEGWRRLGLMQLEWSIDSCPPTGVAAYAILAWINISNLAPIRNFSYELWVFQHIISFFGLIIAIMLHIPSTALYARTYVYIAIGFYCFSRLIQTLFYMYRNIRPGRASISSISSEAVKVRVHGSRLKSWTPGSFVLLGVPRFGLLQSHPATIASTPSSHNGDLIFILRGHRGFTRKLVQGADADVSRIALIDGPYGGKQDDFGAYSRTMLIAGSTGISFTLPILANLASRAASSTLPIKAVHIVWATKEQALIEALLPELEQATQQLQAHGIQVVTHIHVTGDGNESRVTPISDSTSETSVAEKKPQVQVTEQEEGQPRSIVDLASKTGRPDLAALIGTAHQAQEARTDMAIAVCGPLSMSVDVRRTIAGLPGVYLHVEGFSCLRP